MAKEKKYHPWFDEKYYPKNPKTGDPHLSSINPAALSGEYARKDSSYFWWKVRISAIALTAVIGGANIYSPDFRDLTASIAKNISSSAWAKTQEVITEKTSHLPRIGDDRLTASAEAESRISPECVQTYRIFNRNLPSINISIEHAQEISRCADSFVPLTQDVPRCQFLSDEFSNWAITFNENPAELKQDSAGSNVKTYPISADENKLMQLCTTFTPITSQAIAPETLEQKEEQPVISAIEPPAQKKQANVVQTRPATNPCDSIRSLFSNFNPNTDSGITISYTQAETLENCANSRLYMSSPNGKSCLAVGNAFGAAIESVGLYEGTQKFRIGKSIGHDMNNCVAPR